MKRLFTLFITAVLVCTGMSAQRAELRKIAERYKDANTFTATEGIPQDFRNRFRSLSLPLMKWTNILTFNARAITLYAVCLADVPWLYFFFEVFVMGGLCQYMRWRHERMCKQLCEDL